MTVRLPILLFALIALGACGRQARLPEVELSGGAMGTTFNIVLIAPGDDVADDKLRDGIATTLDRIDALASTWREDSELARFNADRSTDWIDVSSEFCDVIDEALQVSRLSDGAFDITVGPLVNLWGFGSESDAREPPEAALVEAAMDYVGYDGIETRCNEPAMRKRHPDMYLDLSGWAKGHAVDRLAELLDETGLRNYLVEIGGELRVRGHNAEKRKWAIAVEAPSTTTRRPHSVLRVTDTSVATSGDYRNYFDHDGKHYSHTIDARTGRPVDHDLAAVTVVNESAAFADAMATALLVLGPEKGPSLAEDLGIAGYFLVRNGGGIREMTTTKFDLLRQQ